MALASFHTLGNVNKGNLFVVAKQIFMYVLFSQHCFICSPLRLHCVGGCWDIEPRRVATSALAVRRFSHSATSHPPSATSHPHSGYISSTLGYISSTLGYISSTLGQIDLIHPRLHLIYTRLHLIHKKRKKDCNAEYINSLQEGNQCSGPVTFWYGSRSCSFVSDLQDASKKLSFAYFFLKVQFTSFFTDKESYGRQSSTQGFSYYFCLIMEGRIRNRNRTVRLTDPGGKKITDPEHCRKHRKNTLQLGGIDSQVLLTTENRLGWIIRYVLG